MMQMFGKHYKAS